MLRKMLITILSLIGVFLAVYLTLYKLGFIGELTCSINGCEEVNASEWATLLGFPVAAWGVGFYVVMFVTSLLSIETKLVSSQTFSRILFGLSLTGLLFSGWLTYLELFVIHAICQYCVASAVLVCMITGLCAWDVFAHSRQIEDITGH
jgi:uncharacterized membrane protein